MFSKKTLHIAEVVCPTKRTRIQPFCTEKAALRQFVLSVDLKNHAQFAGCRRVSGMLAGPFIRPANLFADRGFKFVQLQLFERGKVGQWRRTYPLLRRGGSGRTCQRRRLEKDTQEAC